METRNLAHDMSPVEICLPPARGGGYQRCWVTEPSPRAGATLHRDPSLDEGQRLREMSHGLWQKLGPQGLRVESATKFNGKPNLLHLCKLTF